MSLCEYYELGYCFNKKHLSIECDGKNYKCDDYKEAECKFRN